MKGLKYSLCVHGVLLALLATRGCGLGAGAQGDKGQEQGAQNEQKQDENGQIAKDETIEVDIIPPPQKGPELGKAEEDGYGPPTHTGDNCSDWFGGIGITQRYEVPHGAGERLLTLVEEVHHGYPAERAGIRAGDQVLNSYEIRGEVGTKATVKLIRDGQPLTLVITRDKICTTPPKGKK